MEHKVIFHVQTENNEETIQQQMENITKEVNQSLADIHTDGKCDKDPSGMVYPGKLFCLNVISFDWQISKIPG